MAEGIHNNIPVDLEAVLAFHEDILKIAVRKAMSLTIECERLRKENEELRNKLGGSVSGNIDIPIKTK